jgi:hypothetical protein
VTNVLPCKYIFLLLQVGSEPFDGLTPLVASACVDLVLLGGWDAVNAFFCLKPTSLTLLHKLACRIRSCAALGSPKLARCLLTAHCCLCCTLSHRLTSNCFWWVRQCFGWQFWAFTVRSFRLQFVQRQEFWLVGCCSVMFWFDRCSDKVLTAA